MCVGVDVHLYDATRVHERVDGKSMGSIGLEENRIG